MDSIIHGARVNGKESICTETFSTSLQRELQTQLNMEKIEKCVIPGQRRDKLHILLQKDQKKACKQMSARNRSQGLRVKLTLSANDFLHMLVGAGEITLLQPLRCDWWWQGDCPDMVTAEITEIRWMQPLETHKITGGVGTPTISGSADKGYKNANVQGGQSDHKQILKKRRKCRSLTITVFDNAQEADKKKVLLA